MEAYRDQYATLFNGGRNVVVLAVSADADTALASWARDLQTPILLASDPGGDNVGLFRPVLPALPMAQKHGWTTSVRHSAAIVYGPGGPTILVVLTYRAHLPLADARELARRFVRLAAP